MLRDSRRGFFADVAARPSRDGALALGTVLEHERTRLETWVSLFHGADAEEAGADDGPDGLPLWALRRMWLCPDLGWIDAGDEDRAGAGDMVWGGCAGASLRGFVLHHCSTVWGAFSQQFRHVSSNRRVYASKQSAGFTETPSSPLWRFAHMGRNFHAIGARICPERSRRA